MTTLICGSIAFDTIMDFPGRFRDYILRDQDDTLSVCFEAAAMRRNFGGCAGNIAYTLRLFGGHPLPMATVGHDFAPYAAWMDERGIDRRFVVEVDAFTAQAVITSDVDGNQITTFHPGAMNHAHILSVEDAAQAALADGDGGDLRLGIVTPDGRDAMVAHAEQFAALDIPFLFDPGQQLPLFDANELNRFLDQATWLALNHYEWGLFRDRTGLTPDEIVNRVEALIVTHGAQGSTVFLPGGAAPVEIPATPVGKALDPTGCGDAHRAGVLWGLASGYDWETTGRIGSLAGAFKVEHHGCQNHTFEPDEFAKRYRDAFDRTL